MMVWTNFLMVLLFQPHPALTPDTTVVMEEVRVQLDRKNSMETSMKKAATVDELLVSSEQISFIKRGDYAWEPLLNNMLSERSVITIDGMHVFGACTDKMDPITTYVASNNLSQIQIKSGQEGNMRGGTVAGSIDLQRKRTSFSSETRWSGRYQTGYESNNKQHFQLGNLSLATKNLAVDGSIAWRKAGNYQAGKGVRIEHSQFEKLNSSIGLAFKTGAASSLHVDALYDRASNVGYPALPMDLWLSRAIITSATYKQFIEKGSAQAWDAKIYYNAVEHYMDDTTRPENLVHMDMPGWSTTFGLLSHSYFEQDPISSEVQLNAYTNTSIAEMTMYPQDRSHQTMFAYSWPWVTSTFTSLAMKQTWTLTPFNRVIYGASLGWNRHHSKYVAFNRIFYPHASQTKNRFLPSLHASFQQDMSRVSIQAGLGYGHRAPSVSEAYGYYIYNSFDRYDYVGNPDLPNEVSYEAHASLGFESPNLTLQLSANYFHIKHYIVGQILGLGSPMNYQSVGVKGYTALPYAHLFNVAFQASYALAPRLHWSGTLRYAHSQDDQGKHLPFIRPLNFQTHLQYMPGAWRIQTTVHGDMAHHRYSPFYGESFTPSHLIWDLSVDYTFRFMGRDAVIQLGGENLADSYYRTYADWGDIPRMGRNMYTSLTINF